MYYEVEIKDFSDGWIKKIYEARFDSSDQFLDFIDYILDDEVIINGETLQEIKYIHEFMAAFNEKSFFGKIKDSRLAIHVHEASNAKDAFYLYRCYNAKN